MTVGRRRIEVRMADANYRKLHLNFDTAPPPAPQCAGSPEEPPTLSALGGACSGRVPTHPELPGRED